MALAATAGAVPLLLAQTVYAYQVAPDTLVQVSGNSPIAGCELDGDPPSDSELVENSEVEPYVAVNPHDPDNLVAAWQQDRYSDGGSQGLVTASSFDGGDTWSMNAETRSTLCTGGTEDNGGDFQRASDPWVTFSPDGTAYLMSLSFDLDPAAGGFGGASAMLAMRSTDGGATWEDPVTLRRDENVNVLNDKNSMTADPVDSDYVYAVWDRLVSPPGEAAPPEAFENTVSYRGPTWFTRTTDGGETWEQAREIFDPGTLSQTIGNQIVVDHQDQTLYDFFNLIHNTTNRGGTRGHNVAFISSDDQGASWDRRPTYVDRLFPGEVTDPDDGDPVRTGDIIPEVAVDPDNGNLYVAWQDSRFEDNGASSVAFSMSTDGGSTWSPAIDIDQAPAGVHAFTPMVKVSEDGTVGVSYYDFRNNTSDPNTLPTDEWLVHCHPATADCGDAASWGEEQQMTDTSFDMEQAPVARGYFLGDYEGLDVDGDDFLPLWSMPHGGDQASIFVRRAEGPAAE